MGDGTITGLADHVTPNLTLTGGYRGFLLDQIDFDNGVYFEDSFTHGVEVGVRLTF